MHLSCNLIKVNNASINGDVEIVTDCNLTEEEQHYHEVESNQMKSYETIGATIVSKARSDAETIIVESMKKAKDIERDAYTKGYEQGIINGYEDGSRQGYEEANEKTKTSIEQAVEKAKEILDSAEEQIKNYKAVKESEIITLALEMAKLITKKEFQNDDSIIALINPLMEQCKGETNLIIRCNSNYIASIENKVKFWKNAYAISGEIFVLEDPLMDLGNAIVEKSTGKLVVGMDLALEKLEEALKEFCGEEKNA